MSEIRDALRLHLLQCGFVDPDDDTVPIFTGNDPHFAWTSVDKLIDALTARFEIRDRQAPDETEWAERSKITGRAFVTSEQYARGRVNLFPSELELVSRPVGPWEVTS